MAETLTNVAEILDNFDFAGGGYNNKYPWEDWFDGQIRRLKRGTNFTSTVNSLRGSAVSAARKRNLTIRMRTVDENTLVLQALSSSGKVEHE